MFIFLPSLYLPLPQERGKKKKRRRHIFKLNRAILALAPTKEREIETSIWVRETRTKQHLITSPYLAASLYALLSATAETVAGEAALLAATTSPARSAETLSLILVPIDTLTILVRHLFFFFIWICFFFSASFNILIATSKFEAYVNLLHLIFGWVFETLTEVVAFF